MYFVVIKIEIYTKIGIFMLLICDREEYLAENAKFNEQLEMSNEQLCVMSSLIRLDR